MAEQKEEILQFVRAELAKNESLGSRDLYELAKQKDASVGVESIQQFHTRYVVPFKRQGPRASTSSRNKMRRRKSSSSKRAAPGRGRDLYNPRATSDRRELRRVFLAFAHDMAEADDLSRLVKVLADVDQYVDRIVRISRT